MQISISPKKIRKSISNEYLRFIMKIMLFGISFVDQLGYSWYLKYGNIIISLII
jgi:hypothetical protein